MLMRIDSEFLLYSSFWMWNEDFWDRWQGQMCPKCAASKARCYITKENWNWTELNWTRQQRFRDPFNQKRTVYYWSQRFNIYGRTCSNSRNLRQTQICKGKSDFQAYCEKNVQQYWTSFSLSLYIYCWCNAKQYVSCEKYRDPCEKTLNLSKTLQIFGITVDVPSEINKK